MLPVTLVVALALAPVLGPALGKVIEEAGTRAVPLLLAGVSAVCPAVTLRLMQATRPRPTHDRPA